MREQRLADFRDRGIAAHMIRVRIGVDQVTDRFRRNLLDRGDDGIRIGTEAGIHDHHTVRSNLDSNVAASPGDHIEVGPQLQHLETGSWILSGSQTNG